jgi:F-type H+-transporting ATPase subunit b
VNQRVLLGALLVCVGLFGLAGAAAAETPSGATATDAAHGAAASHAEPNIFAGGFGNMVWTTIVFLIVVYILGTKAWPQLLKTLRDREKSIADSLADAKREREDAQKLMQQYQTQLQHARAEASAIIDEGRRDAEVLRQKINSDARRDSEEMVARARREIQLATDAAVKELYDRTAELATQVAGTILQRTLSPADHKDLVAESIRRMESGNGRLN